MAVFTAAYLAAAGFLSYVWSEGNERTGRRFHALFIVGYGLLFYLLFVR